MTITQHKGIVLPLNISNVDTDAIIPKQFLKKTTQYGFGKYLFSNWRFLDNTCKIINKNFILNKPCYKNASILLTRENFGCGSSREHAVWALMDYGFFAIISPSFSDIFYNNCIQNKLLAITLSNEEINQMFIELLNQKKIEKFLIDLDLQTIFTHNKNYPFKIKKSYLYYILNNIDCINCTLQHETKIINYENNQKIFFKI